MSEHTPGPWTVDEGPDDPLVVCGYPDKMRPISWVESIGCTPAEVYANAHLIAAAPELFAEIESTYIFLANIENQWPGRHSQEKQGRLCRLRDLICTVTRRNPQDVQDDYGNRAVIIAARNHITGESP